MINVFEDCYISFENNVLTVGNSLTERKILIKDNMPVSVSIGKEQNIWLGENFVMMNVTEFDYENAEISFNSLVTDFGGESKKALSGELVYKTSDTELKQVFSVFPKTAAISYKLYVKGQVKTPAEKSNIYGEINSKPSFPESGAIDAVNMNEKHIKIDAVKLCDETDFCNELVIHDNRALFNRYFEYFSGNMFILEEYVEDKTLMIVFDGYVSGKKFCDDQKDFCVNPEMGACIFGHGVEKDYDDFVYCGGTTVVCGTKDNVMTEYKRYYSMMFPVKETYIMSNTWGDRNCDTAVCEQFVLKEIDMAYQIGVDVVQIDDGWQKGLSLNSGFSKDGAWGNWYEKDADFWEINKEKFPNGFSSICDYAKERNIKLGLWFSLDKAENYASWERDALKVAELYRKYGMDYFKIDGLIITSHECERNIYSFIKAVEKESNGNVKFNFDITMDRRFGYFMFKQYSTLFVENRYTDWKNYYPHNTLRNLWSLSAFIPANKLQFEVLNQRRNDELYGEDLLKPSEYPIDYIFASVMVSNPLIWMEMSSLDDEQVRQLKDIIFAYKKERKAISQSLVFPIGERPDGMSYTGFNITQDNKSGYFILLREKAEENSYTYNVSVKNISDIELLATNSPNAEVSYEKDKLSVRNMEKAGYMFLKY